MTLECRIATPSDIVECIASIAHRIIGEERLTREQFGATYDAYAESVRAFVPGLIGWLGPHVFEIGGLVRVTRITSRRRGHGLGRPWPIHR